MLVPSSASNDIMDHLSPPADEHVECLLHPGRLVVTEDGRCGWLSRFVDSTSPDQVREIELKGRDGRTSIFTPRDLRYIFTAECEDPQAAA